MVFDQKTLRDLAVLPVSDNRGPTLWGLIDRTRTRAGRKALHDLLIAPSSSPAALRERQLAHRELGSDLVRWQLAIDRADLNGLERYLGLNWQLPDEMPALASHRSWWREYQRDVGEAQRLTHGVLSSASVLRDWMAECNSSLIRSIETQLASALREPAIQLLQQLLPEAPAFSAALDQQARGNAKAPLLSIVDSLAALDAMWSVAAATAEHAWSYPSFGPSLAVSGLWHPFLPSTTAVTNDLDLSSQVRVCFVTGPNMAGKSTFMKAIALALLLAHLGSGVPARSMQVPATKALFASINIVDNVQGGESFYLAEVRRLRVLAQTVAEHQSVCAFIDEPFRGTNVHDASEATLAISLRLATQPSATSFIASHIGEIAPQMVDNPAIRLLQFCADTSGETPTFDYRLREGVSTQRLGMTLLRQEGVLDALTP